VKNDIENAKSMYLEALKGESDCVEAIYNLGKNTFHESTLLAALHQQN
jgi:GH24 family phage-related lysozyme (muramidase)